MVVLGPTRPPFQWLLGALSLAVRRQTCETDHTSPSSAEVKNTWNSASTPPIHLHGVMLN
jgi:hypothetical protein